MSIVVKINNLSGPLCSINADQNWTVAELKMALAKVVGVPRRQQRLLFGFAPLRESDRIGDVLTDDQVTFARIAVSAEAEYWIARVRHRSGELSSAPDAMKRDHEVVLAAMQGDKAVIRFAAPELLSDRDFAAAVVAWSGEALEHLLPSWKADKTIVLTAIKQSPRAIRHASDSLRSQKDFLIEAISCSKGLALQSLSQDRIQDRELQQAAVRANWMMLGWLRKQAPSLSNDAEVVFAAVANNGCALEFASSELRDDTALVALALQQSRGAALRWASEARRSERELVYEAVVLDATMLQYASEDLRGDPDIVMQAVQRNGNALRYADAAVRGDRRVVEAALQQAGPHVLAFAGGEVAETLLAEMSCFDIFAEGSA